MAVTPHEMREHGPQGAGLTHVIDAIRICRATLAQVRDHTPTATSATMTTLLTELGELALVADAAEIAVITDATTRGLPGADPVPLSPTDWIATHSRRHTAPAAARLVRLADALRPPTTTRPAGLLAPGHPGHVLGEAILTGHVSTTCADLALTEMRRLTPDLQPAALPVVWEAYTDIASGADPREIRRLRPAMYARFGRPDLLNTRDERARAHTHLSPGTPDPIDGLTDYHLRLDPAGAATLEAALDPLASPLPGPDGTTDPRPWATRRADALMELIDRAIRAADNTPTQPATLLSLLIPLTDLRDSTGHAATITGTDAGRYLAAATARRLTCATDTTPIITAPDGAALVIGRTKRLFTRRQIRALHLRDHGCTFPHCTRPAGWSDAHHLIHWADGGTTDLTNAALLCPYHHHIVHTRRLAGHLITGPPASAEPRDAGSTRAAGSERAGPARITWDLCPGSYDRLLLQPSH